MSKMSLELRWFFKGLAPLDVQNWFNHRFSADWPRKEKARTDLYFIVRDREDLGLKLSRGRLELKWRQESQPFSLAEPRVSGVMETWIKEEWRLPKDFADYLDMGFGKPHLKGWRLEVPKNRTMRKYQVDALGNVSDPAGNRPTERFFKVELTSLSKHARPWWTLGMEISGESKNLGEIFILAVRNLLDGHPQLDLQARRSYGYPHWLIHSG